MVFINQQSQTALLVFCTSTLNVKDIVTFSYAAGTLFGFSAALAYQYWSDSREVVQTVEPVEMAATEEQPAVDKPMLAVSSTLFASQPAESPQVQQLDANDIKDARKSSSDTDMQDSKKILPPTLRKTTRNLTGLTEEPDLRAASTIIKL